MTETETSLSRSQKNPRKESEERIRRLKLASHAAPFIYRGGLEAGDVTGSSSPSCPLLSAPPLSASFASMGVDSRRANIAECNGEEKPVSSIHHFNFFIFQFSLSHLPPNFPIQADGDQIWIQSNQHPSFNFDSWMTQCVSIAIQISVNESIDNFSIDNAPVIGPQ